MLLYVGCYTRRPEDKGITLFELDEKTGALRRLDSFGDAPNLSYLYATESALYAVSETDEGELLAYSRRPDGSLVYQNRAATKGAAPCHISLWGGRYLSVTNYTSGSMASYALRGDGSLSPEMCDFKPYFGPGLDADGRQECAHMHSSQPDPTGEILLAANLGHDVIHRYAIDRDTGALSELAPIAAPQGTGPRHFCFSPSGRTLYVAAELKSRLLVYDYSQAMPALRADLPLLPNDFAGMNLAADIHLSPDGRFLYVSNRGHESIAVFAVDASEDARFVGRCPAHGSWPRNFCLTPDGRFLLIANQFSNNIAVCPVDPATGLPGDPVHTEAIDQPVCLAPV